MDIISTSPVVMLAGVIEAVEKEAQWRKDQPFHDNTQKLKRDRYIEAKTFDDVVAFLKNLRVLTPELPSGGYQRDAQALIELEIKAEDGPGKMRRVWANIDGVCWLRVMLGPKCVTHVHVFDQEEKVHADANRD